MNDISILTGIDQRSYSSTRDDDLAPENEDFDSEFLTELQSAHESADPIKESDINSVLSADELNTESTSLITDEHAGNESELENPSADESALISGDAMLAQINSAKTIDMSVTKHENTKESSDKGAITNLFTLNSSDASLADDAKEADVTLLSDTTAKSDKILSSLTAEQREQLNAQLQKMDKTNNSSNVESLKNMLAEFVSENDETQVTLNKQTVSSDISALSSNEKQGLYNQLKSYIQTEQPEGEQLASLELTLDELEESIDIKSLLQTKDGTEQSTARVSQLFTQITTGLNTVQENSVIAYNNEAYEKVVTDLQTQHLQTTAQVKQASLDPSVMQAINIVKSDAAKQLQERVSSMLSINNKQAEIRLDPPELGSMQIRIRSDAEQAQINFVVQNQQAKEALEQSLPRLREMLAEQGVELGESTVSYNEPGNQQAENNEADSQSNKGRNGLANEGNSDRSDEQSKISRQQSSSSIDYYA